MLETSLSRELEKYSREFDPRFPLSRKTRKPSWAPGFLFFRKTGAHEFANGFSEFYLGCGENMPESSGRF